MIRCEGLLCSNGGLVGGGPVGWGLLCYMCVSIDFIIIVRVPYHNTLHMHFAACSS